MTLDEFIGRLDNVKRKGKFYVARAPHREDAHPSLSVWEENGWIKLRDWGSGDKDDVIIAAMGLTNADLRTAAPEETAYSYHDEKGNGLFRKVRRPHATKGKTFIQEGMNGERDLSHLNGKSKTLYRLTEVQRAVLEGRTVYVVNGEKAVEAIRAAKGIGTCQPQGESKDGATWLPKHTAELKGANVVIVADNDEVGHGYAKAVWNAVRKVALSARIVRSKTGGPKEDAFDHLCAGFGLEDFELAPDLMVEPNLEEACADLGIVKLSTVAPVSVEWLWYPYIPRGRCTIMDGDGDLGKSFASCGIAASISNGFLPDGKPLRDGPGRVLIFASEDEADDTIVPRIEKFGGDAGMIFHVRDLFPFDPAGLKRLRKIVETIQPVLVILDPVLAYAGAAVNINAANEVRPIFDELKNIANENRCGWLNIRHEGKSNEGRARHQAGIGSVDIRNAHRSQLVVSWHPDVKGLRTIAHLKHNLSEEGRTFGYEFRDGEFVWRWDVPAAKDVNTSGTKLQEAIEFLYQVCEGQYVRSSEVERLATEAGISVKGTLKNARKQLSEEGQLSTRRHNDEWLMHIKSREEDPFERA